MRLIWTGGFGLCDEPGLVCFVCSFVDGGILVVLSFGPFFFFFFDRPFLFCMKICDLNDSSILFLTLKKKGGKKRGEMHIISQIAMKQK